MNALSLPANRQEYPSCSVRAASPASLTVLTDIEQCLSGD